MDPLRKRALIAGALYLLTFVSIPTLALYQGVHEPGFVTGPGPDTPVILGGFLEMIVALAGIGTAIALYPLVKRQNESFALGLVAARTLEAAVMFAGVASLWTLVGLRQAAVGQDGALLGQALVTFYDRAFLVSQSLIPAVNALFLGTLLYQSRLVPRILPVVGLIGAPLLVASHAAVALGVIDRLDPVAGLAAIPIALWEFSLGVYLVVKGFRPSPIAEEFAAAGGQR